MAGYMGKHLNRHCGTYVGSACMRPCGARWRARSSSGSAYSLSSSWTARTKYQPQCLNRYNPHCESPGQRWTMFLNRNLPRTWVLALRGR